MLWWTEKERIALALLGASALAALGVLIWQEQRPPIAVEAGPPPPYGQWDAKLEEARRINVNAATPEELERLPEVGPSLAKRIVEYRAAHGPFRTPEELERVPGIGPKTVEALREYLTAR